MTHKCKVYQHSHLKANEETLIIPQRDALGFKNSCSISSRKLSKICPINDWWIFSLLDCISYFLFIYSEMSTPIRWQCHK